MASLYVNPVELLGLASTPVDGLDLTTIKKARRRLIADLDLGDGFTIHHGQQLDHSACEQAFSELDDSSKLQAWYRLANLPNLNQFLGAGDSNLLLSMTNLQAVKRDKELLDLISPRYAEQYDKALVKAFEADDYNTLEALNNLPLLFNHVDSRRAYASVSRLMREQIDEITNQAQKLDEDDDEDDANEALEEILTGNFHSLNLGHLPGSHFSSLRSEFAMAVRNYAVKLFNTFDNTEMPLHLLESAVGYDVDEQTADKLEEDLAQIREIVQRQEIQARQEAVVLQFQGVLTTLMQYSQQLEQGTASNQQIKLWANKLAPSIATLNALTQDEAVEPRNMLAMGLRNLSVSLWNESEDGATALAVLNQAIQVSTDAGTAALSRKAKNDLSEAIEGQQNRNRVNKTLEEAVGWIKQVDRGVPSPQIKIWLAGLADTIRWLNSKSELVEGRQALALSLRALAITSWNKLNDGDTAKQSIATALELQVDYEVKANLRKVSVDLAEATRPKGLFGWIKKMLD